MTWNNRIVGHGLEVPSELLANPQNWRIHPQIQQGMMEGALEEIGWIQEVVVNQRSGYLIDGHLRVMIAMRNGDKPMPVLYVDLDDPISSLADEDTALFHDLLESVTFSDHNLQEWAAELLEPPEIDEDDQDIDTSAVDEPEQGQAAVLVTLDSENAQARAYEELTELGYDVKVVNT
jgi:hypothetical protein